MRLFLPIILTLLFLGYLAYLGWVKKTLKTNLFQVVYPGLFFIGIWAILYYLILR